ncbi:MAG: hypothetical protein DWB93_03500 [Candidatus Poseidoniales archaeon]|nr:MAG: hypothetical protein DWB93_03500 [Candidatus Poseidoniales archaeon]
MMMKILSILPGFVGFLCISIMIGSIIGFSTEQVVENIPIVPCSEDEDIGCRVAMTNSDIEVPQAFNLLDIEVSVAWEESERSWFGVIQQYDELCEPDNNGLTNCTEVDFEEYIIAGGSNSDGELKFRMEAGDYRFITGGKDASTISNQDALIGIEIHLNSIIELIIGGIGIFLFLSATEMAFPLRELYRKFREA